MNAEREQMRAWVNRTAEPTNARSAFQRRQETHMGLNDKALNQIEAAWGESRETINNLMARPDVSDDFKLIAAAILQAGAWISLSIDQHDH
jgi:hypothetical protein